MKKLFFFLFAALLVQTGLAQKSRKMTFPRGGVVNPSEVEEDFHPMLRRLQAPSPGGEGYRSYLETVKAQLPTLRPTDPSSATANKTAGLAADPTLGTNFIGNSYINGVPNDNDMAISNDSMIVSVINSNIFFFKSDGTNLGNISLDAWATSLGVSGDKYDPRALYDPVHDRFIIAFLNGFVNTTSAIIVGFSQTNDPLGNWNLYALPGDPNQDTLWTDYPIMALTEHELFITGNLLRNGEPWQTGFEESICWQIDLDNAYSGDSLETRLWDDVNFGNGRVRNLCPVQGGSMPGGPNMYLVSNRNFDVANDTVFIMEITDTMNAPNVQFLVDFGLTDVDYGMPPNAIQQFTQLLATNDARWLDAVIENGNIQFVGNCLAPSTGLVGAYHGTITDVAGARTVTGTILTDSTLDYGYPGIAWAGLAPGSEDMMIAVNYTGTSTPTTYGMIFYEPGTGYSDVVRARAGQSYINVISGIDRWGDYTGIQTKYDQPGVVWTAATWGRFNRQGGTWISEYTHPAVVSTSNPQPVPEVKTFPNPTTDWIVVDFFLDADAMGEISLQNLEGKTIKVFIQDRLRSGKNEFHFTTDPLPAGTYFLTVKTDDVVLATKKIVKVN